LLDRKPVEFRLSRGESQQLDGSRALVISINQVASRVNKRVKVGVRPSLIKGQHWVQIATSTLKDESSCTSLIVI